MPKGAVEYGLKSTAQRDFYSTHTEILSSIPQLRPNVKAFI